MNRRGTRAGEVPSAFLLLAAFALLILAGCGEAPRPEGRWRDWSTLRLEARATPLIRGEFEMKRTTRGQLQALETRAVATVLGQPLEDSRTLTLFDPSGRTSRHARQSRRSGRRFVFGEQGYTVEKLQPPEVQGLPLDQWAVTSTREYAYPTPAQGAAVPRLFDYFGLLLELSNVGLGEPGDQVMLHVATANGPMALRVAVAESREGSRTFTDLLSGDEQTVQLREFRLRIIPADPEQASGGFLRMEGETEIWVEAESKTPLEISGRVPSVPGRVQLRLVAIG